MRNDRCKNCQVYHDAINSSEPACCAWLMDNVVLGNKTVDKCPNFQEYRPANDVKSHIDDDNIDTKQ